MVSTSQLPFDKGVDGRGSPSVGSAQVSYRDTLSDNAQLGSRDTG